MIKGGRKELKKRKIEATFRRVFAIALALIMMLSTVELSSIRVLATENSEEIATEEVSQEITAEETEESLSEEVEESVLEEIPESEDAQENDSEVPEDSASEEPEDVEFAETEEIVSEETDESKSETESSETVIDITVENKEEKALPYLGEISEGETYGRILVIDGHDMESAGMEYTTENLIAIFRAQTVKFNRIVVNDFLSYFGTVIPMNVWNEAVLLIEENEDYLWNLCFGGTNESGCYYNGWQFGDVQFTEEDIVISFELYQDEYNDNFIVCFDEINVAGLTIAELSFDEGTEFYNWAEVELERTDEFGLFSDGKYVAQASCHDYESSISLVLLLYNEIASGKEYTLKTIDNAFGIITEYSDGTTGIDIYADDGKESINLERLGEIVSYWSAKDVEFEFVEISHFNVEPSVIKMEIYNLLFEILSEDGRISFSYINYDENDEQYNVKGWDFNNPVKLKSDFDGSVEFRINESGKPEVEFSDNSYKGNDYMFYMNISEKNDFCQEFLLPKFGEPDYFDGSVSNNILLYENDDSYNCDALIRYLYNEGQIYLFFDNVETISKDIANVMYRCSTENKGYIDMIGMTKYSLDEEGATNISYEILSGNAIMQTLPNEEGFLIQATTPYCIAEVICRYKKASGVNAAKIMDFTAVKGVTKFRFVDSDIEHDWNGDLDEEYLLEVDALPENEYVENSDCIWEVVSGNSIELLESTNDYGGVEKNGSYRIVGYGETVVKASYASASCTAVIRVLPAVEVPEIPTVYVLPQVQSTLAEIDLNSLVKEYSNEEFEGTFSWSYPETKLGNYSGYFVAQGLYTVEGRKPVYVLVPVSVVLIKGVEIGVCDDSQDLSCMPLPVSVKNDDNIVLCAELMLDEYATPAMIEAVKKCVTDGEIQLKWTDKEKGTLLEDNYETSKPIFVPRSYTATSKGKKTLQVSVINTATNKAIVTKSAKLTVTADEVFSFNSEVFKFSDKNPGEMKGEISFEISTENYKRAKKLTFKSEDTSVLKLGKVKTAEGKEIVTITIPYEFIKPGTTTLSVISSDELKSTQGFCMERVDYIPKLKNSTLIFDKTTFLSVEGGIITCLEFVSQEDVLLSNNMTIKEEKYAEKFEIYFSEGMFFLYVQTDSVKNGTYNLTLQSSYSIDGEGNRPFETKVKVIVKESKVNLSIKQTNEVNVFYKSDRMVNLLMKPSKGVLVDAWFENEDGPFEIECLGNNECYLNLKENYEWNKLKPNQKKVTIRYMLYESGNNYFGQSTFTVKTIKKAPKIKDYVNEMYTYYGLLHLSCTPIYSDSNMGNKIQLIDSKTGKTIDLLEYDYTNYDRLESIRIGKNDYYVYTCDGAINLELMNPYIAEKATDVIKLRITNDDWNGSVNMTIKNKVINSDAKVKLYNKSVTLNADENAYRNMNKFIYWTIGNFESPYFSMIDEVEVIGLDNKSKKVLEDNLSVCVEPKMVYVRIYDKGSKEDGTYLEPGTYKYKVNAKVGIGKVSFKFTVKITESLSEKIIKVTQKGSINVLDRDNSYISLSAKASDAFENMHPEDFYIEGLNANLFDYYFDSYTGECRIYAREFALLSTKVKYQVIPVCVYSGVKIKGAPVTIQVKQGAAKLLPAMSYENVLYVKQDNELYLAPEAYVNNQYKSIQKVELINYTDDLTYADGFLRFRTDKEPTTIKKSQGTYTLKFAVTLEGAAVDKAPLIYTCKVKIVR